MVQCVSTCQERQCEQNKVVTKGVSAPLEVFYTGEPSCGVLLLWPAHARTDRSEEWLTILCPHDGLQLERLGHPNQLAGLVMSWGLDYFYR